MILQPLEAATADLVVVTLQRARQRCLSPVVALHQAGLLMTEDLANRIRYETLMTASAHLERTRIRHLHEKGVIPKDPTPAVLVKGIAQQVEWWADAARRGEFR